MAIFSVLSQKILDTLTWATFGDSQSRPFQKELSEVDSRRSGETWTLSGIFCNKSFTMKQREGQVQKMILLNNQSKRGGSFPLSTDLDPGSSLDQTFGQLKIPPISSELLCKESFWEETEHGVITSRSSLLPWGQPLWPLRKFCLSLENLPRE